MERESQRVAAAELERARWARELHDETLQNLAALRLALASQLRSGDPMSMEETLSAAIEQLDGEIAGLRALITDLRPTALDELGVAAAVEDLAVRARGSGLEVELAIELAYERGLSPDRQASEIETAVYRIAQEALTNARKHGGAHHARIDIRDDDDTIRVRVSDDGGGFDPGSSTKGFGIAGMRERAELLSGTLEVQSAPGGGTTVIATVPTRRRTHALTA
jgi:signal transduction histidine kinase